jgi:hypothetical protein
VPLVHHPTGQGERGARPVSREGNWPMVEIGRRDLLKAALSAGIIASIPVEHLDRTPPSVSLTASSSEEGYFLRDGQDAPRRSTCQALCARIVPTGADARSSPGATEAGAVNFIDRFLAAFELPVAVADQPAIYLHGRYSGTNPYPDNRDGTPSRRYPDDDFVSPDGQHHFLALTPHQRLSWRMQLDGREALRGANVDERWLRQVGSLIPAPAMVPLRTVYTEGLDAFEGVAQARYRAGFAQASASQQDELLAQVATASSAMNNSAVYAATEAAIKHAGVSEPAVPPAAVRLFPYIVVHTFEACYSQPAYGGNRDRVMWRFIGWDGDTQPLGNSIYDESLAGPGEGANEGFGDSALFVPRGGYRQYRAVSGPSVPAAASE